MPRLDQELVHRRLAPSRARAQVLIAAGAVMVDGAVVRKGSKIVEAVQDIVVTDDPNPYVSRGGLKLAHALDSFGIDPAGLHALDLGASTGGFSDVLLRRGVARIIAVDVGHGQLHRSIAQEPRVTSLERQDVRRLTAQMVGSPDLIVADLAFISLTKALPVALSLAPAGACLVALIKPQFELSPAQISKGGIVRDAAHRHEATRSVTAFLERSGWRVEGLVASPVAGGDGNEESLVHATKT